MLCGIAQHGFIVHRIVCLDTTHGTILQVVSLGVAVAVVVGVAVAAVVGVAVVLCPYYF